MELFSIRIQRTFQLVSTAISELVHIFPSDGFQLFVGEHVIGMGIEREVDHRLFRPAVHGKVRFEATHAFGDTDLSLRCLHHAVSCQCPRFPLLHFFLIVIQRPVDGGTGCYLCNHCSNSLVRRMISLFNDTSSTVSCSSL